MISDPNSNIFTKSMSQLWHNASQLWHCVTIVTRLEILVLIIITHAQVFETIKKHGGQGYLAAPYFTRLQQLEDNKRILFYLSWFKIINQIFLFMSPICHLSCNMYLYPVNCVVCGQKKSQHCLSININNARRVNFPQCWICFMAKNIWRLLGWLRDREYQTICFINLHCSRPPAQNIPRFLFKHVASPLT